MLVLDFINVGNADPILGPVLEGAARREDILVDCVTTTLGSWTPGPGGFTPGIF